MLAPAASFVLPSAAVAKEPPELRGIPRDQVRLLVIERKTGMIHHARFSQIADFLAPGDLLVFNNSRTIPAVLHALAVTPAARRRFQKPPSRRRYKEVEIRLAEHLNDDSWYALFLGAAVSMGETLLINQRLQATVLSRHTTIPGLWRIRFSLPDNEVLNTIYRAGEPVRYEYVSSNWALDYYQTVYAREPGSAEMPSAGRAFTWKLLFDLKRRGIEITSITLHATISSYMDDAVDFQHPISEEEYMISDTAAAKINTARQQKRRIIAIGTTVVRSLESAVKGGMVQPVHDYTRLHIDADFRLQIVNGLLTGFHEPEASHLDLLRAFLPAEKIRSAYAEAIAAGYLWHEFGDVNLIL